MPLTDNTPQFYQEAVNTAMLALMEAKTTGNKDAIKAAHKQHDRAKAARKAADQWALSLVVWPEDTQLQTFMKDKNNETVEDGDMVACRQKIMRDIWVIINFTTIKKIY